MKTSIIVGLQKTLYSPIINSKQIAHNSADAIASKNNSCTNPGLSNFWDNCRPMQAKPQHSAIKPVLTARAVEDIMMFKFISKRIASECMAG